ncbi:MAG: hypothetical protein IT368_13390, partial [Candidatus Hydrogenedentes bacterium]|nr:hypothetical protein [Candidatus Hydrogenedentota bacterium]
MSHLASGAQISPYVLKYYGPAVMYALGEGYVGPESGQVPALQRFLNLQQADLFEVNLPEEIPTRPLSNFEGTHSYSMKLIGLLWRLFGIHWAVLFGLEAVFYGALCACGYGLLRLAMGRFLATVLAIIFVFSPGMMYILPQFRDFSKAPFLLAELLLIGVAVKYPMGLKRTLLLAAALGLVLGIGLGFRQDFLAHLPGAAIALCVFVPGRLRESWVTRVTAPVVLVLVFTASAWPILRAAGEGANSAHNIALGFTKPFNDRLGLAGAPYEVGHHYVDAYMHTQISQFTRMHGLLPQSPGYAKADYEDTGSAYLVKVGRTFTADMVMRWYRAVDVILSEAPFAIDDIQNLFYPKPQFLDRLLRWRWNTFGFLAGWGSVMAGLAIFCMAVVNLRWALAAGFVAFYFAGYSSLQFHVRHYFPLEILFFFALGTVLHALWAAPGWMRDPARRACVFGSSGGWRLWQWPATRRIAGLFLAAILIVGGVYAVAYMWQRHQVDHLFQAYLDAPRRELDVDRVEEADRVVFRAPTFLSPATATAEDRRYRVQPGVIAVAMRPPREVVPIAFRYKADAPHNDFTQTMEIPAQPEGDTPLWIFFPVFQTTDSYFGGGERRFDNIMVYRDHAAYIEGIYDVTDFSQVPLLVNLWTREDAGRTPHALKPWRAAALEDVRAFSAYDSNLFDNGSFVQWDADVPAGTLAPAAGSTLARESRFFHNGGGAVRETQAERTPKAPWQKAFRVEFADLPAGRYEVYVRALHPFPTPAQMNVIQGYADGEGRPRWRRIAETVRNVLPSVWFQEFSLNFVALEGRGGPAPVDIGLRIDPKASPGSFVIWDALRVVPAPGADTLVPESGAWSVLGRLARSMAGQ